MRMCARLRACTRNMDINSKLQPFCLAPLPHESETLGKGDSVMDSSALKIPLIIFTAG